VSFVPLPVRASMSESSPSRPSARSDDPDRSPESPALPTPLRSTCVGPVTPSAPCDSDGRPAPLPTPLAISELPGKVGGRYQLGEEIARGGMGAVLQAHDAVLDRDLAVKVLLGRHREPALVRRFVEEAQVAGQLQHPGVVPVHDLGTLPDG